MPLYDYECPKCGVKLDVWAKIYEKELICDCGEEMRRLMSPTRIQCDIEPYFDENLADNKQDKQGKWVKSRQHRQELLKEQGLIEIG